MFASNQSGSIFFTTSVLLVSNRPAGSRWVDTTQRRLPEAFDRTLFADVTFGLVLRGFRRRHSVQDRQPDQRLGLQAHPLQEVGHLNSRLPWGLSEDGGRAGREVHAEVNNPNIDRKQEGMDT